jgi:hypothetical protein
MQSENFENFFKATEFNKIATEIGHKIAEHNIEIIGETITRMSDRIKHVSTIKKPEEFIELQKEFIAEDLSLGMEHFQKLMNLSLESIETLTNVCAKGNKATSGAKSNTKAKTKRRK